MFEQISGIPAHPLIVHAAVVFVPLLALGGVVYAVLPRLRRQIRWAVVALAIVGPGSATLAKLSGEAFRNRLVTRHLASPEGLAKIDQHQAYGDRTMLVSVALGVIVLALAFVAPGRAPADPEGSGAPVRNGAFWLQVVLSVAAVAVALVAGYYVFKTGDTGAHSVWSGL